MECGQVMRITCHDVIVMSYFSNPLYSNRKFVGRPGSESMIMMEK